MGTKTFRHLPLATRLSVLENGLTVITVEQLEACDVNVQFALKVGALQDENPGTAHFLEHLLIEGPARKGVHPALRTLRSDGAEINGAVSYHASYYTIDLLTAGLETAIQRLYQIVFRPAFSSKALAAERLVIENERLEDEDDDRYNAWKYGLLYPRQTGLRRPITGTRSSLSDMNVSHVSHFHRRWYTAVNSAIIISGAVTHEQALEIAADLKFPLGEKTPKWRSPALTMARDTYQNNLNSGIELYFSGPNKYSARQSASLSLAYELLDDQGLGLLWRRLRNQRGLVYGVSCGEVTFPSPMISINASAHPTNFPAVEEECLRAVEDLTHDHFSKALWLTILAKRRKRLGQLRQTRDHLGQGCHIKEQWLSGRIEDYDPAALIASLTRDEVVAAAARYLDTNRYGCLFTVKRDQET